MLARHSVMQRAIFKRDLHQIAASFFHCFLNGCWHLFRFAFAHANATIAVTDDRQCRKTQNTTTLDHLGHAVDRNHFFTQTVFRSIDLALHLCL